MIKWIVKYGVVIVLLNTILLAIPSTRSLGNLIFLSLMIAYSILIIVNPKHLKEVIFHKAFFFFLILNVLNILYFTLFHSFDDITAIQYLLARGVQFSIISFAIIYNYNYFKKDFLIHVSYVIIGVVILGLIIDPFIFSGRYRGIIWNPNMFSSFTSMAFAVLFLREGKRSRLMLFLLFLLFIVSLASGSRDVLVSFLLLFLFKYGFSRRNFLYALLGLGIYFLTTNFQLDTSINRFASQELFNDRLLQYRYAYETILQKPFIGFGLDKYAYINSDVIPEYFRGRVISAHNGYLAILTQYGLIFGLLIICIILYKVLSLFFQVDKKDVELLSYLYIACYVPIAALYETFLTGINEFHTILFWFSLAFLSFSAFKHKHES